jgi:hypothetical protein
MYQWMAEADIYRIRKALRVETDRSKAEKLQTRLRDLQRLIASCAQ